MNKQENEAYKRIYGDDWQTYEKKGDALTKSTKRNTRVTIPNNAIFSVPKNFAIVSKPTTFEKGGKSYDIESFVVFIDGKNPVQFFESWLSSTGFKTWGTFSEAEKVTAKKADEEQEGTTTANEGDMVTLWQNAGDQNAGIKAIGGHTFKAEIIEYYFGRFDETLKPRFRFTLVK